MHAGGVLQSWKQIANYVGRTERTVQRWEREFGFPIRRPSGKARSAVMALVSEIEEWTRGKPSLVEIQQTGRLSWKKFERGVTRQEITIKANLSPSPEWLPFWENLANFRKELARQAKLRKDLANLRREHSRINKKLRKTITEQIDSGNTPKSSTQQHNDQRSAGGKENVAKRHCA